MSDTTHHIVLDPQDMNQLLHIATLIENRDALRPAIRQAITTYEQAAATPGGAPLQITVNKSALVQE